MSFQNACVCDANADQKLPRYCRVHITWRNILVTTNKIVASADRPLVFNNILWCLQFYSKDFHLIVKFLYGLRESKQTTRKF